MKITGKRIAITLVAGLLIFMISVPLVNDYSASQVGKKIKSLPLPERTQYIERISKAGKLTGNGNGMQYFGGILIKSELSLEELETYYAKHQKDYIVETQYGQGINFLEHAELSLDTKINGNGYYLVYSWGEGKEPFSYLDIRGH